MSPGIGVMLADTDVGSIITAGQSGVQFGCRLLLQKLLLVASLCIVPELTVRLGIAAGRGHRELIREHFGGIWARISVADPAVAAVVVSHPFAWASARSRASVTRSRRPRARRGLAVILAVAAVTCAPSALPRAGLV
jgi:hypothetical protein